MKIPPVSFVLIFFLFGILIIPKASAEHIDLDYVGDGNERQMLDLLLPDKPSSGKIPLVVWIHGGGWRSGTKASGYARRLVGHPDYAVARINYRLTKEAVWPAQLHDCKAAIRYLRANASKYGIDPDRIAVAGSSAGGHLASCLGTMMGGKDHEGEVGPHLGVSTRVSCVMNFLGGSYLCDRKGNTDPSLDKPGSAIFQLMGGKPSTMPKKALSASPLYHVDENTAPFLFVHGTSDSVVIIKHADVLVATIERTQGIDVPFVRINEAEHGRGFGPTVYLIVKQYLDHQLLKKGEPVKDQTLKRDE